MQTGSNTIAYVRHFKSGAHKQKFIKACAAIDISLDQGKIDPRLVNEYHGATQAVPIQKAIPSQVSKAVKQSLKRVQAGKTMWNPTLVKRIEISPHPEGHGGSDVQA